MNILNRLQAAVLAILMLGTLTGCGGGAAPRGGVVQPPEGRPALATLSGSPPSP